MPDLITVDEQTQPDIAIAASWRCECCGRPMVTQTVFLADPDTWRARGYRRHGAGRKCNSCYHRARRGHNTPARPRHDRDRVIAEWRRMWADGEPLPVIAQHLGMSRAALNGLLKRARRDGLIEQSGRSGRLAADELARLRAAVGLPAVLPAVLPAERAS